MEPAAEIIDDFVALIDKKSGSDTISDLTIHSAVDHEAADEAATQLQNELQATIIDPLEYASNSTVTDNSGMAWLVGFSAEVMLLITRGHPLRVGVHAISTSNLSCSSRWCSLTLATGCHGDCRRCDVACLGV